MTARTKDELRNHAEIHLEGGCRQLMRAFNLLDEANRGYVFAEHTRKRAEDLIKQLMGLHFESEIEAHPRAVPEFQRFLQHAASKPKRVRTKARG